MKKFGKFLICLFICICLFLIISKPEIYIKSAFEGIKLWAITVLPALLPFFFFTALLSTLGVTRVIAKIFEKPCKILFNVNGAGAYAFLMSVISGYPIGAKTVCDLKKSNMLDDDESTRCALFCSTSGPLFIVGSVGYSMFQSKNAGALILISHILSAIFCGILFRFYGKKPSNNKLLSLPKTSENALYDCVYSSVISVLLVGGFICVFYLFSDALKNLGLFSPITNLFHTIESKRIAEGFLYGLIECTKGCKTLSSCSFSTYSLAFSSALVSFGGFSVLAQSIIFLNAVKVKIWLFCISKVIQSAFAFCICLLLFPLFF